MSKNVYIGVGGVARKVKNIYIGVGGVARKVKKGYIGVGGVARLFYESKKEISKVKDGEMSIGSQREWYGSASLNEYAIFAGGYNGTSTLATADVYDESLTYRNLNLVLYISYPRKQVGSAVISNYAVFLGGNNSDGVDATNAFVISSNLTLVSNTINFTSKASCVAGASNDAYAVFAGGHRNDTDTSLKDVISVTSSLTYSSVKSLNVITTGMVGASLPEYALFAGGLNYSNGETEFPVNVFSYDKSLTQSLLTTLDINIWHSQSAIITGKHVIFGGYPYTTVYNATTLTKTVATSLSNTHDMMYAAIGCDDYALFAGGLDHNQVNACAVVEIYDESLTKTTGQSLYETKCYARAAKTGNYLITGPGRTVKGASSFTSIIDIYQIT